MSAAALDAVERIQAIIEGLLTLTRSERAPERRHPADLAELVEANLDPLREDIARQELTVSLDLQSAETSGTPALLERAVANLLGNAVLYNRPGGHISVSTKPVDGRVLPRRERQGQQRQQRGDPEDRPELGTCSYSAIIVICL